MSNKVNEALFDLIKSMSKSEKRYFKLLSSRHTIGDENKYILLFDHLDDLDEYDEDRVFAYFKGEAFLNRFSITKKRLYDHILSSLDSFHSVSSVEAQLYKQLHNVDILFEKSLYDQCRRLITSAEKAAKKNELTEILLLIEKKKRKLVETAGYLEVDDTLLDETKNNHNSLINTLQSQNDLWVIKSKLFSKLSKKGVARSLEETRVYEQLCLGLTKVDYSEFTTETAFLYFHTMSAYHYATGNMLGSLEYIRKNIDLVESDEKNNKIEFNRYVSLLTNAIYITDKIGDPKESHRYLQHLKTLAGKIDSNEDLAIKLFSSISSIELSMMLRKGEFDKALKYSEDTEVKLQTFANKLTPSRKAYLEFKLAVIHLGNGNYNVALKWINSILNDSRLDRTEDIIGFTQLLDLLVHIELNNDKLLPYSLKSVQRYFKSRNRMYSFERVFLQFISKLIRCEDRFEAEIIWKDLYDELSVMTNEDAFESVALEYFDFQSWAEFKLSKRPFEAIVREKYNNRLVAC